MNLLISTNQFQNQYLVFLDRRENMIIDGIFSKILYSTSYMILNGLFISFPLVYSKKQFSKLNIDFDVFINKELIKKIAEIEKSILNHYIEFYNIQHKTINSDLYQKLQSGSIKYYSSNKYPNEVKKFNYEYYIKISGIWETNHQIGLTYKIIEYQTK